MSRSKFKVWGGLLAFAGIMAVIAAVFIGCASNPSSAGATATTTTTSTAPVTASSTASGLALLTGKVLSENRLPVSDIDVELWVYNADNTRSYSGKKTTPLTTGDYVFQDLGPGNYVVFASGTQYTESSVLMIIQTGAQFTAPDLVVIKKTVVTEIPTLDLGGVFISGANKRPLTMAQVSLDTGQSTVTDANGSFTLTFLSPGPRRLTVNQPGMSSYTVSFEVSSTAVAWKGSLGEAISKGIIYNGVAYDVVQSTPTNRKVTFPSDIEVLYNLNDSSILIGTVYRYIKDAAGAPTYKLEPYGGYEFEIFVSDPEKNFNRAGYVKTDTNGQWKLANLPGQNDNSFEWLAVATGTVITTSSAINSEQRNIIFSSNNPQWQGQDLVFTRGYRAKNGQTSIIEFTVPTFVWPGGGLTPPSAPSGLSMTKAGAVAALPSVTTFNLAEDIIFWWTGNPGGSNANTVTYEIIFNNAFQGTTVPATLALDISGSMSGQLSQKMNLAFPGLGIGKYLAAVYVLDPNNLSLIPRLGTADHYAFTVAPGIADLYPNNDADRIVTGGAATLTVAFPSAQYITNGIVTVYEADQTTILYQIPFGSPVNIETSVDISFTAAQATAGTSYYWKISYFYADGSTIESPLVKVDWVN